MLRLRLYTLVVSLPLLVGLASAWCRWSYTHRLEVESGLRSIEHWPAVIAREAPPNFWLATLLGKDPAAEVTGLHVLPSYNQDDSRIELNDNNFDLSMSSYPVWTPPRPRLHNIGSRPSAKLLFRMSNLQSLHIPAAVDCDDVLTKLRSKQHLRFVSLDYCNITGTTGAALMECRQLAVLSMNGCTFDNEAIRHLGGIKTLSVLGLSNADIADDDCLFLSHLTELRDLSLSGTRCTDHGLTALAPLLLLESIALNSTAVSDQSIATLCQFPNLKMLSIAETQISADGVERLRNKLPAVKITWLPKQSTE